MYRERGKPKQGGERSHLLREGLMKDAAFEQGLLNG